MANFKPQATYTDFRTHKNVTVRYNTFRELKKELKELCKLSVDNTVSVSRSKRGEWGEWFERYYLEYDGSLIITKQTWL